MTHPARYHEDDPLFQRVQAICLALPEAKFKVSHGQPAFYTGKVFAYYSAVVKGDHQSDRYAQSVVVLPDAGERAALLADPRMFEPGYLGPYGWVGLDLRAGGPDWDEVAELVDASYRNTATKRLVRLLDDRLDDHEA